MTPPASTQPFGAPHSCASCGAPFTPVVMDQTLCDRCHGLAHPEPGNPLQDTEVAGYRLVHEIGAGRFSHSWLAEDETRRPYILKLLRRYATDPNSVQRFLAEAQRLSHAAELAHPNLARPVNAGVHLVSAFFLVYESGGEQTLADELRERGRLPTARALDLCAQVADGLSVLHGVGVTHLDLKPANVALSRLPDGSEQAVVLDAVTAHLLAHVGLREGGPLPLASAAFVSPEESRGARTDARSDLYAVGVLLFQLLSGRLPFGGACAEDLLRAHREHPPLRLKDAGRRVHADLETLVARLLSKDPTHRPHGGDELAVLLRSLLPIADSSPRQEPVAPVEDTLPLSIFPTARELTPPQMLPPPVDPALERAMMGEVPPAPPEKLPGIPSWVVRPSRLRLRPRPAAVIAAALGTAGLFSAVLLQRAKATRAAQHAPAPAVPVAIAMPVPPASSAAPPAPHDEPEPPLHRPALSPNNKSFDLAQKAIWTQKPAVAQSILKGMLRRPALSRRDRARASKLMGDAEVKRGHKSKAVAWYRKAFRLYDDPEERAKVAKLLQR